MELEDCKRKTVVMLKNYRENEICIKMLEADLQVLDDVNNYSANMAVSYDQPNGGNTNKVISTVERALIRVEQRREELQQALSWRREQKRRIDLALESMPTDKRTLLQLRYIDGMLWKQVCQHINYSEDYIRKELNERALETMTCYLFPALNHVNLFADISENPRSIPRYEEK